MASDISPAHDLWHFGLSQADEEGTGAGLHPTADVASLIENYLYTIRTDAMESYMDMLQSSSTPCETPGCACASGCSTYVTPRLPWPVCYSFGGLVQIIWRYIHYNLCPSCSKRSSHVILSATRLPHTVIPQH